LQVKIDLHVHSNFSYDSLITPREISFYAKKHGLSGVAVTDHDRLDGALEIAKHAEILIIPGMEISSLNGHIIGLNVQESIPSKRDADETVDRIHEAGGIAVACHPMVWSKQSLGRHTSSKFDAVEVVNASAIPFRRSVKLAHELALALGIAEVGGTDAHYGPEIGCGFTIVNAELKVDDIIKAIAEKRSQPCGNAIPLILRLKRELLVLNRKIAFTKKRNG
jgi:predicted metal-dependent phosphoesterase TrpH